MTGGFKMSEEKKSFVNSPFAQWIIPGIAFIAAVGVLFYQMSQVIETQKKVLQKIDTIELKVDKMEVRVQFLYDERKKN